MRAINSSERYNVSLTEAYLSSKFAIHADFVVTASREDIHGDSKWNQQLRDAIPDKFGEAVELLSKCDSSLAYTWPRFLVSPQIYGEIFQSTMDRIMGKLKTLRILRTETGEFVAPNDTWLVRFPAQWRFGQHKELPIPSSGYHKYLSHLYDVECTELLGRLGVMDINKHTFWSQFKDFTRDEEKFGSKSEEWHIMLATLLNSDNSLRQYFSDLRIIPVEGGQTSWASSDADKTDLFITADDFETNSLPRGLKILFIPKAASRNEQRKQLFQAYGAKDTSQLTDNIAKKIRETHHCFRRELPSSSELTTEDLISHASFLFRHRMEIKLPDILWVATDSGGPQLASATFVKPLESVSVPVIHRGYHEGLLEQEEDGLVAWMCRTFGMPEIPRLIISDGTASTLSPEMEFIAQNSDSFEFLDLLRRNWSRTSHLLTKGAQFQEEVWNWIVSTEICCQDGQSHPLKETCLPSDEFDIPKSIVSLPLLPIPQESAFGWQFLGNLGVKLRPNLDDWLQYLTDMRDTMTGDPNEMLKLASSIYSTIENACEKDINEDKTRDMVR